MPERPRAAGSGNRLLDLLPQAELSDLLRETERTSLGIGEILFEPDEPIRFIYFPVDCVISTVVLMEDGSIVEFSTIGKEGMAGLPVVLGDDRVSNVRALVQVPGEALRMAADSLRRRMEEDRRLRDLLARYALLRLAQVGQTAACNRVHNIDQRAAKWLLLAHDRVGRDEFPLTHEFLAEMLGVRRASVSTAAGRLKDAGVIDYRHGRVTIADRAGLEKLSCECYQAIRRETDRLYRAAT